METTTSRKILGGFIVCFSISSCGNQDSKSLRSNSVQEQIDKPIEFFLNSGNGASEPEISCTKDGETYHTEEECFEVQSACFNEYNPSITAKVTYIIESEVEDERSVCGEPKIFTLKNKIVETTDFKCYQRTENLGMLDKSLEIKEIHDDYLKGKSVACKNCGPFARGLDFDVETKSEICKTTYGLIGNPFRRVGITGHNCDYSDSGVSQSGPSFGLLSEGLGETDVKLPGEENVYICRETQPNSGNHRDLNPNQGIPNANSGGLN